jgi:hypothetical protein
MVQGPLTLKELEISLRDLSTDWFLGNKSDTK